MNRFPIANIAHSADVTRWHSVPSLKNPSIAEHSFLVTLYSLYLAQGILKEFSAEEERMITRLALWHDMAETITGDLPTPVKRYLESLFPSGQSPLDKLEERLCEPYAQAKHDAAAHIRIIVKLGDVLDAIHFAENEIKGRARRKIFNERKQAFKNYVDKGAREFPQFNWEFAHVLLEDLLTSEPTSIDFKEFFENEQFEGQALNPGAGQWETKRKGALHAECSTWTLAVEIFRRIFGRRSVS